MERTMQRPRIASIEGPVDFERELDRRWQIAERLKSQVAAEVVAGDLDPQDGFALVSSITGTLFGYRWFHGDTTPNDLAGALLAGTIGDRSVR